jgi:ABC-2 type transport system permease protein
MKLLESKLIKEIRTRLIIIKTAIIFAFQKDTAYVGKNWSNMFSTFVYTISYLIFLEAIYFNIDTLAGYARNEMLLFTFISQISFYVSWIFFYGNLNHLSFLVNKGDLDLILTKPLPSDFYISFRNINILLMLRDSLIPIFVLGLIIDWSKLNLSVLSVLVGMVIWILGLIAYYCLLFIFRLPVFWFERDRASMRLITEISYHVRDEIPYEGFNKGLKILFTVILPLAIDVNVTTSVMLQKSNPYLMLVVVICVVLLFSIIRKKLWKIALRNYSSASS